MSSRQTLTDDLRALGLERGQRVVVHSSLRAVGPVEGGPDAVADALVDVLGPGGLLVAPTFTYDTVRFDPLSTPGRTGALGESLRRREGAIRSLHPSHSLVAVGRGASALCAAHEERPATDVDTPLDRLAGSGGHVLLLGVGHISNTTMHVGEFHANVPYLEIPFSDEWPRAHEIIIEGAPPLRVEYDRFPGCSRTFGIVERGLREREAIRDGRVGSAQCQFVKGTAVIDATLDLLQRDANALLCTEGTCYRCTRARALTD